MKSIPENDDRREQFVALFVRHEAAIHSFVLTLLPDLVEAEDIVQQASLTMWRKFDDYTPGTSFRNWAFQVAKFTAMNHMTKLRRDRHVFHESLLEMLADRAAQRSEQLELQRRALAFCIERLGEDDRQLLAGCYAEASTIRGVAEQLGRTANAVYKQLQRLRTALLKCVELRLGTEGLGAEGRIMSHRPLDPGLRQLVASVVDGESAAAQREELENLLLTSPAACDFYLDYVNLHSALRRRFLAADDYHLEAGEFADFRRAAVAEMYPARRTRRLPMVAAIVATAIALILVIGWYAGIFHSAADRDAIATLRGVTGDVVIVNSAGSRSARVGDALRPGDTLRVGGAAAHAAMAYPDGTLVRVHDSSAVQSPSELEIRLRLLSGSMEVDAAKQPPDRPLVFATEHSRYVVLGTRFRLYCEAAESRLELDEGKVRLERPASGETVEVVAGNVAISADELSPVVIQPLSAGRAELVQTMRQGGQAVNFSEDGDTLFSNNWQSGLKAWGVGAGDTPQHEYRRDPSASDGLAINDGNELVHLNREGQVIAWRPAGDSAATITLPERKARSRTLSPDGGTAAVSADKGTKVYSLDWKLGESRQRYTVKVPGKAWCLALSRGGNLLAAGFWDGSVRVYGIDADEVVFESRLRHTPTCLDLTADGRLLVVFTQKDGLNLIELATGEQRLLWPAESATVRCVSFAPDGQCVIAGLNDRTARMWSVGDGRQLLVIDAGHSPQGVAWSEELQMLATADGAVKLWKCSFDPPTASALKP